MKRFKLFAVIAALFCCSSLYAKDFDWSQCWCNYGAGLKQGNMLVTIDGGLWYNDLSYWGYKNAWVLPPVMVEVQYAQPIWKLPFTFGGYAGLRGYGWETPEGNRAKYLGFFFGGEVEYHVMLPPENLDVYAVTRIGAGIPLARPDANGWTADPSDFFHTAGAIGASWFFNKKTGINLEFGYPMTKFGVIFKL